VKGRKLRVESDPRLAKSHAAGATVTVILPALHQTYGLINLKWPRYWVLHLQEWRQAHDVLVGVDTALLELPVDASNQRSVLDDDLLQALYATGVTLVVSCVLTFAQFELELARVSSSLSGRKAELSQRLVKTLTKVGFDNIVKQAGWQSFIELHKYRDALMHPGETNVYGMDDGAWAQVPLAWFASGRAIQASAAALTLIDELATFWESTRKEYDRPATLTVKRGMRSLHQVKKSPASRSR
jgi:hypothetical protein